jgi:hypothetical protein
MMIMRRLKLYLDTSVISLLLPSERPEWTADTIEFWNDIVAGVYMPVISDITIEELEKSPESIKNLLYASLAQVDILKTEETEESLKLAQQYIRYGVLKEKNRDDCRHIALATITEVDYIVSWNFKHFVNVNIIDRVQAVNKLNGYREIKIISPQMLGGVDDG